MGAFRNKSVLYNNHIYQDDQHHHLHRRNSNADKKFNGSGHIKKQQPIRRQSQSKIERRRASVLKQFLKVIDQLNQDYLVKRHWLMLKNC